MTARSLHAVGAVVLLFSGTLLAAQNREFGRTQPPRDSPAQATGGEAEGTATISGRVVAADTGEPLKRARVTARVSDARGLIVSTTDAAGRYALVGLRAGRYTISVSRPGFVTLSYGQRRPRQPATPIQVLAGDDLHDVSFSLPRGSVITGQLVDEDGVALPLAAVRAMRYVYRQGQRQLVPVGEDRSDDRGQLSMATENRTFVATENCTLLGEDVSAGADILPVMPVGCVGLDAGSGATGVLANTRRDAAEPAVT